MIDTHVHFDAIAAHMDVETAWREARDANVTDAIAMTMGPQSWRQTAELAGRLSNVHVAIGIHPQVIPGLDDAALHAALDALPDAIVSARAVAVGEIGIDGPAGDLDRQERVLRRELDIARQLHLPICLHVYGSHAHMLALLTRDGPLVAGGVVHGYSGSAELVSAYVKAGLMISLAGAVTRSNARRPLLAARAIPIDSLLIETDAPYQPAGADARDRAFGRPADLAAILDAIARARGQHVDALAAATTDNARRLFPHRDVTGGMCA